MIRISHVYENWLPADAYKDVSEKDLQRFIDLIEQLYQDASDIKRLFIDKGSLNLYLPNDTTIQLAKAKQLIDLFETQLNNETWDVAHSRELALQHWKPAILHHLLRDVSEYELNINTISASQREIVKAVYTRLSYLTEPEYEFIMHHYKHTNGQRVTDKAMAEESGIAIAEYRKQRLAIEAKLLPAREHPHE